MCETADLPLAQLNRLLPPSVADDPGASAYELVRAVLIRSTYNPGIRHRLGWRGIHEAVVRGARPGSITAKINRRPGVFALHPVAADPLEDEESGKGRFALCYFPDPNEALVEDFSIGAGIQAMAEAFTPRIRNFGCHPELVDLFHIGWVEAAVDGRGIFLAASGCERLAWIAPQGIEIQGQQGPVQAVAPGGIDQDLGAWALVQDFFSCLAASFTYTLSAGPSLFCTQTRPADFLPPLCLDTMAHRQSMGWFCRERREDFDWDTPCADLWDDSQPLPPAYDTELWWRPASATGDNSLDKKAMGLKEKPRFILLTGFLGAGKTSFLDRFIQAQTRANHFVAVVQNEIGEKGLDARLLDESYAVTEMDEGCVCCSLAGNLRAALSDILERFQPDFIVLETTGLANPANILQEIDELQDILEFGSITTLVDGPGGAKALERFEVARDQVRLADVILMNKCDLIDTATRARLEERIQSLNPVASIHPTVQGDIHPGLLYGVNFRKSARRPLFMGTLSTHQSEGIETRMLRLDDPVDASRLTEAIQRGGGRILRVKGIGMFAGHGGPMVFQYAPGTCRLTPFEGRDTGERFLVIIGRDLEEFCRSTLTLERIRAWG